MKIKVQRIFSSDDLEEYEELDDKQLRRLTKNQKQMLLEDEREKATRNANKIINRYKKEGGIQGEEKGRLKGKKHGTVAGAIIGGLGGGALSTLAAKNLRGSNNLKRAGVLALGTVGGSTLAALAGRHLGGKLGAADGKITGEILGASKGRRIAKEEGHDSDDILIRQSKKLDKFARKNKEDDTWEFNARQQLKEEANERKLEAEKRRKEELERKRVAAEERVARAQERKAKAEETRARIERNKYWDDVFRSQ